VNAEISRILDLGITLKTGVSVGKDISLEDIRREFAAVYIVPGAQGSAALGIKGEENGIYSGLAFLKSVKKGHPLAIGKKVLVIGGGNTAIDAARAVRRLGSDVTILYRRTASEMPAHREEVDAAVTEGVKINFLLAPVAVNNNGLTCVKMELGDADESGRPKPVPVKSSEFDVPFDTVIAAVGQDLQPRGFESLLGSSWIAADGMGVTREKGIFAGGDAVTGPGLVSEAIGAGRKAALAIDAYLNGEKAEWPERKEIDYSGVPLDAKNKISRNDGKKLDVAARLNQTDAEVNLALDSNQVLAESKRCLGCGLLEPKFTGMDYFGKICIACHNCEAVCPQQALEFQNFYRVDEGRWAYDFDYPERGRGIPNPLMLDKPVPLEEIESRLTDVEKVIYRRRSVRVYKKDPVPKELINRVLEAGRFAPSAGNCQGWKFVVITDRNVMDEISASTVRFLSVFTKLYQGKDPGRTALKKMLAFIKPSSFDQRPMLAIQALSSPKFGEGKLDCFFGAPAAILLLTHRLHVSEPELGMGICGQNMVLAAHSLGLGTCYVGFISSTLNLDPVSKLKFRKKLGIGWPYDSVATVLTLGYPAVDLDKPVDREFPKVQWVE
jgi:nitroreductase/thioredoxin reductase